MVVSLGVCLYGWLPRFLSLPGGVYVCLSVGLCSALAPTKLSIVAAPTPSIGRGEGVVVGMGGAHSQFDSCVHACAAAIAIPTLDVLSVRSVAVLGVRGG